MKKLLLLILVLGLCSCMEAQAQSQTSLWKRPKFSPQSRRAGFVKPPFSRIEAIQGDSSLQDERGRSALPPHLRGMPDLPPHLAAEKQWPWKSENEGTGLAPNDPLDRLYSPHTRALAQMPTTLKTGAPQILSGSAPEAWVARYEGLSSSNDIARAMVVDAAGNVYVTGYSESPEGTDVLTVKYTAAGIQQWTAKYNGPGNVYDEATALCIDAAGNIYVTGHSSRAFYDDYTLYSWNGANDDYATIKYNAAGTQEWAATYNRPGYGYDHPVDLGIDAAGNVYVTGRSWIGNDDYATVKYNPNGTQEWAAVYNSPENWNDYAVDLAVDDVGNVYVTGSSQKAYSSFDSSSNYVTIKYNTAGTLKWIKTYNGPGNGNDVASALAVDSKGNVYVTGYSNGSVVGADYATIKYDSIGTQQWVATVGSGRGEDDYPVALAVDGASNVYVTGVRGENFYTVKYNSAGVKKWAATYNGPEKLADNPVALGLDAGGNVYVTGSSYGLGTYSDYATVKYNALGVEKWIARHDEPSPAHDMATAMVVDDAGNIYVTGSSGTVGRSQDYLTIKYNAAGVQQWAAKYNGPGNGEDWAQALAVDAAGNVYVTGSSGTVKYNSAGKQQWVGDSPGSALALDGTGNVYSAGSNESNFVTIRYNSAGAPQWFANYNGPGNSIDYPVALAVDHIGNIYVAGSSVGLGAGYDFATIKYLPSPLVDAGPDKEICAGGSIQIGGNPTGSGGHGGPYTFSWSPLTGLNDPTLSNPIAAPAMTTTYTVTVTETSTGLAATDEVTITARATGWAVAHIVDVDDIIFGINQSATVGAAPRDHRGLALSPNKRFLYLGYNAPYNNRIVRKIDLSVSDPADNHHSVVAQLKLPPGTQPAKDIATDDKGRVYLALGTKITVSRSNLQAPPLHSISGLTACEGVTTRRENGTLVVYATDRIDKTLKRFVLVEGTGETIVSSNKTGLDGDGEVLIKDIINNRDAISPRGLAVQSNGTIWVADLGANQVFRFHADGSAMTSIGANRAMDVAIDETRSEVYISQYTLRRIKVCNLNGVHRRFMTPAITNIDLDGEDGMGALCGIDVASCQRVFVANEKGRSILTNGDSPFSNVGDNNDIKAADTDPVLVVTGSGVAKESEIEESGVTSNQQPVTSYELAQNYPNPFSQIPRFAGNPSTTIRFALPEATEVNLKIYDVTGQLVQTLVDGVIQAGRHQVVWDGANQHGVQVASGIYFYQLQAREFKQVRKMSLLR